MNVDIKGLQPTLAKLGATSADIRNPRDLTRSLSLMLLRETTRGFALEIDPFGRSWQKSKRAMREGGQTLTDTGRLRASFTPSSGNDFAQISTNLSYARYHQQGDGKLPRRQMLGYGPRIEQETLRLIQQHIGRGFNVG